MFPDAQDIGYAQDALIIYFVWCASVYAFSGNMSQRMRTYNSDNKVEAATTVFKCMNVNV